MSSRRKTRRQCDAPPPFLPSKVASDATLGLHEPRPRPGVKCSGCGKACDELGRCWKCKEWTCRCGRLTGSVLISGCGRCEGVV